MDINYLKEKQLAFLITTHCTLNCKHCGDLIPYFKRKKLAKHIPLEQIKQEYKAVFQIYDYIEDITVTGGEPFLYPQLSAAIDACMEFEKQFDHLRIFSNGTIVPKRDFIEQLKKYNKLSLVIDDYGPKISTKVADIRELFENENLPLRVNNYHAKEEMYCGGWIDYGSPEEFRNYSDNELETMYRNCHMAHYKCLNEYNGKLINCSWVLLANEADIFPKDNPSPGKYPENQILDILDESIPLERKREVAASWGTKPNWQCQYCNGFDVKKSKRIPGGEQI